MNNDLLLIFDLAMLVAGLLFSINLKPKLIGYVLSAGCVAGILLSGLAMVPMSKAYYKELTITELNSVPANDKEDECEDSDDDDTNPCK
ncbi:MAG: hypothetical protein DRR19_24030 [Candidatus Parabeggiatoa sp. nov. 1]|nr:MAG: hypothetical protein DRR19_24030 [Gammaproteobacteria bacterium]